MDDNIIYLLVQEGREVILGTEENPITYIYFILINTV